MNNAYKYFIVAAMVSQFAVAESMLDGAWERLEKTKVAVSSYPEAAAAYALGVTGGVIALGVTQILANKFIPRTLFPKTLPVYTAVYGINTVALMEDICRGLGIWEEAYVDTYIQPFNPISRLSSLIYYCTDSLVEKVGIEQVLSTEPLTEEFKIDIRSSYEQGKQDVAFLSKLVSSAVLFKGLYENFSQDPERRRAEEFVRDVSKDKALQEHLALAVNSVGEQGKPLVVLSDIAAGQMGPLEVNLINIVRDLTYSRGSEIPVIAAMRRVPVDEWLNMRELVLRISTEYDSNHLGNVIAIIELTANVPAAEIQQISWQMGGLLRSAYGTFSERFELLRFVIENPDQVQNIKNTLLNSGRPQNCPLNVLLRVARRLSRSLHHRIEPLNPSGALQVHEIARTEAE